MALTYHVPAGAIDVAALLEPFVYQVACEEADLLGEPADMRGAMRDGVFFRLYMPLVSTRSIELGFEAGRFSATAQVGASDDDHVLARQLAARAATVAKSSIAVGVATYSHRDLARFETAFGAARIREQTRFETATLVAAVRNEQQVMKLDGPVRTFHFGPRMLSEILTRDAADRDLWLTARIHATQWPEVDHVAPDILEYDEPRFTAVQWRPGVRHLLESCDYYMLAAGELDDAALAAAVMVPAAELSDLAGDTLTWLDERNAILEPVPVARWDAFLARARRFHRDPFTTP